MNISQNPHSAGTDRLRPARNRAFTLLEMILVLGIIALLLGVGTYSMVKVLGDAERGKIRGDMQALKASLIRYRTLGRIYPSEQQGLEALVTRPTTSPEPADWTQYMKPQGIKDPWGRTYEYRYPGKHNPGEFDIFSLGADGKEGTEDDLGNWDK